MGSAVATLDTFTSADLIDTPRNRPEPERQRLAPAAVSSVVATPAGQSSLGAVFMAWSEAEPHLPPSRELFTRLACEVPATLAAWVFRGTLTRGHLSHAAEILGRETRQTPTADGVILVLERLLTHPSPAVREGAVCGLGYHLTPRVRRRLSRLLEDDPSEGVREAIEDLFEE